MFNNRLSLGFSNFLEVMQPSLFVESNRLNLPEVNPSQNAPEKIRLYKMRSTAGPVLRVSRTLPHDHVPLLHREVPMLL